MSYRGSRKGCYGNFRKAQRFHAKRSKRAKLIDEGLRAPLAKSTEQWMAQPNRFDCERWIYPRRNGMQEAASKRQA